MLAALLANPTTKWRDIAAHERRTIFIGCAYIGVYEQKLDGERTYCINASYQSRITLEPGKRSGHPCIRGLRITVYDILRYLAAGMTIAEVLEDFPMLTAEDIVACLQYAADRERQTIVVAV